MLLHVASLNAYKLRGLDGDIGGIQKLYFDAQCWAIRYVAAATGNWLGDKQVLISPHALTRVAWNGPHQWGAHPYIVRAHERTARATPHVNRWTPRLHSIDDVNCLHIQARDGDVGRIADFLIDDETWEIRDLISARRNWWSGKRALPRNRIVASRGKPRRAISQ